MGFLVKAVDSRAWAEGIKLPIEAWEAGDG